MRRLFLSLIITLGALAAPTAWAGGKVQSPGTSLADKGKTETLNTYLKTICGATYDSKNKTWSIPLDATDDSKIYKAGTVFFVTVNDYWIGSKGAPSGSGTSTGSYDVYNQINEGVESIEVVDSEKGSQTTNSGKFYTHDAKDVTKFFFIVKNSSRKSSWGGSSYNSLAFSWFNEWSYVENTGGGYTNLISSLDKLSDGAPFFAPHDCDTSLETNHFTSLDERDPRSDSDGKRNKVNFTAYLYVPKEIDSSVKSWEQQTIYVSDNGDKQGYFYNRRNGTCRVYKYFENPTDGATATTVYTKVYNEVPYMFFYRIKLGEIDEAGSIKSTLNQTGTPILDTDMKCYYTVDLNWGTSFDRFVAQLPNTTYENMQEHFIIQRSDDKTNWKTIGIKDLEGNKVKNNVADYTKGTSNAADYKVFTDNTLPDFNETTKKIGYTVYYRIVSEVQKADGTVMSTTNSNVITVNIPGTTPFKLTLEAGGTSKYTPGTMDVDNYNEGSNLFVNTLTAGRSLTSTGDPTLSTESVLNLVCTTFDAKGNKTEEVIAFASCATYGTSSLDALINAIGKVKDDVTTVAGEKYDAQYQLVLELGDGKRVESNIVKIVNSKVSNTSVSVHRSGTPDAATCAERELFRNEVKFKPQMSAVPGAGYYIYCNGDKVLTLNDNTNSKDFNGDNGTKYTVDKDGIITMTFFAEHLPIAVGETGETSETTTSFHYAVAHFDASGNTYGSAAEASVYSGAKGELVVTFNKPSATLIKSYYYVIMRPVVTWNLNKSEWDDVASPIRYEVYLKQEQAEFEKTDNDAYKGLDSSVDTNDFPFGEYKLRTTIKKDSQGNLSTSFADDIYYARKNQYAGSWVNPIAAEEIRPISYYVRAIYKEEYNETERNKAEKNSDVYEVTVTPGGIFTDIEGVSAEGVSVEANDGVITVAGASGTIVVYSATGQAVATAQGDGGVTTIDASNLNGVYIVKANNMKPTKILIK